MTDQAALPEDPPLPPPPSFPPHPPPRRWTDEEGSLLRQCKELKAVRPELPCIPYLDWDLALPWYSLQQRVMADPSKDHWWHKDDSNRTFFYKDGHDLCGRWLNGTAAEHCNEDKPFDFRVPECASYFVDTVVRRFVEDPSTDGVFFDSFNWWACGGLAAYKHYTTADLQQIYNATVEVAVSVARLHAAHNKTPIYSLGAQWLSAVAPRDGCVYPEDVLFDRLQREGLGWARYYEGWVNRPGLGCATMVANAILETSRGLPVIVGPFEDASRPGSSVLHGVQRSTVLAGGVARSFATATAEQCQAACDAEPACLGSNWKHWDAEVGGAAVTPNCTGSLGSPCCYLIGSCGSPADSCAAAVDTRYDAYNKSGIVHGDISFSLAAFLIAYGNHSYYGAISGVGQDGFGYEDGEWRYYPQYEVGWGQPLGPAVQDAAGSFTREFSNTHVVLHCDPAVARRVGAAVELHPR